MTLLDIGGLTIPPVDTPTGGTIGTLILRLNLWSTGLAANGTLDWVMLMPANQGFGYGTKASATDVVWADSRSKLPSLYIMSTADVVAGAFSNQVGSPPLAHPKGSRVYLVGGGTAGSLANGWNVAVTYAPRWLNVR